MDPVLAMRGMDTAFKWDIRQNADFAVAGATPFENGRLGHKTWTDVNGFADFWSWFNLGVGSLFWPMGWELNEVTGNASWRGHSTVSAGRTGQSRMCPRQAECQL